MDGPLFHRIYEQGHIVEEVPFCDPLSLFAPLCHDPFALFLDASTAGPARSDSQAGRWSFLACDPFLTVTTKEGRGHLNNIETGQTGFDLLETLTAQHALPEGWTENDDLPLFTGGFAGFLGYEMGRELERLPARKRPSDHKTSPPDMALGAYDCVLAFDHIKQRAFIISTGLPEKSPAARAARAEARAAKWRARLALKPALSPLDWPRTPTPVETIRATTDRSTYEARVKRVIDYIFAGDIFQANLSQRFEGTLQNDDTPFTLYRRLRALSPAPFAGFFHFGDGQLLSSSPERFLKKQKRHVEAKPIKGTRPRGRTPAEDQTLARELLASEKDRAENVMIVDLLRNDLSRVCVPGSLRVPKLCALESFATVHHLVSTVEGKLARGASPIDLLKACFPGGSITGAPKLRAMEIISELEDHDRGPYCGSLGFLSFDGAMDMNISIRTMLVAEDRVSFRAGGGIVADSNPAAEYEETRAKASAMERALRGIVPKQNLDTEEVCA